MLYDSLIDTAKTSAMVFIILFGASAFTGIFMSLDGDVIITNFVMSLGVGRLGALAIMLILVFIMGMFINWTGIVMIVLPIFLPIMDNFGVDRLWLVGVTAVILQTCFMCIVLPEVKISEIYKGVIPFILIILFVTVLCIAFPQLVTGLPNLVAG